MTRDNQMTQNQDFKLKMERVIRFRVYSYTADKSNVRARMQAMVYPAPNNYGWQSHGNFTNLPEARGYVTESKNEYDKMIIVQVTRTMVEKVVK